MHLTKGVVLTALPWKEFPIPWIKMKQFCFLRTALKALGTAQVSGSVYSIYDLWGTAVLCEPWESSERRSRLVGASLLILHYAVAQVKEHLWIFVITGAIKVKLTKYSRPGETKIVCVDHNLLIGNSTEESNADENQRLQMSEMDVYNLSMRGQWSTCLSWKTLFYKRTFLAFDVTVINYVYFTNTVFLLVKEEKNVLQVYRAEQQKYQASKYSWTHSRGLPQNGQKSGWCDEFRICHLTWKSAVTEPPQTSINSVMS